MVMVQMTAVLIKSLMVVKMARKAGKGLIAPLPWMLRVMLASRQVGFVSNCRP
jgi:hypothetical protein